MAEQTNENLQISAASLETLPARYKVLHFQEQPPRSKALPKEIFCRVCYASFSYTTWRYDCNSCGHSFCSQHGRESLSQIVINKDTVRQYMCVECFLPQRLAALEDEISETRDDLAANSCKNEDSKTSNVVLASSLLIAHCSMDDPPQSQYNNHDQQLQPSTMVAADPTKSLIANVMARRNAEYQPSQVIDDVDSGSRKIGLLAAAVASPVVVGRAVLDGTVGLVTASGGILVRGAAGSVAVAGSIVGTVAAAATAPLSTKTNSKADTCSPAGQEAAEREQSSALDGETAIEAEVRRSESNRQAVLTSAKASAAVDSSLKTEDAQKRVAELEAERERLEDRLAAAEALRSRAAVTILEPCEGDIWERGRPGRVAWMSAGVVRRLRLRVGHVIAGYVTSWVDVGTSAGDWGEAWVVLPATLAAGRCWSPVMKKRDASRPAEPRLVRDGGTSRHVDGGTSRHVMSARHIGPRRVC
jgi:hypothetical protein